MKSAGEFVKPALFHSPAKNEGIPAIYPDDVQSVEESFELAGYSKIIPDRLSKGKGIEVNFGSAP